MTARNHSYNLFASEYRVFIINVPVIVKFGTSEATWG